MSRDTWVMFEGEAPAIEVVQLVLEDYVRDLGNVRWDERQRVLYATLPGKPSDALRRVFPNRQARHWGVDERWFEVSMVGVSDKPVLSIATRSQDDITNAVAENFAKVAAACFQGRVVEG